VKKSSVLQLANRADERADFQFASPKGIGKDARPLPARIVDSAAELHLEPKLSSEPKQPVICGQTSIHA
jgi:hypothetical protein